eukprot:1627701-Pyramimonas_sp.AAC.1
MNTLVDQSEAQAARSIVDIVAQLLMPKASRLGLMLPLPRPVRRWPRGRAPCMAWLTGSTSLPGFWRAGRGTSWRLGKA